MTGIRLISLLAISLVLIISATSICHGGERIRLLIMIRSERVSELKRFFEGEPCIDFTMLMSRGGGWSDSEIRKVIRLYFPRTYQAMQDHDAIMVLSPAYYLFTTKQDKWIHDMIADGGGGISGSSIFSQVPGIAEAWASGLAWQAFPNDAPGVIARGPELRNPGYFVEINKEHPEPILTIFVPFEVENVFGEGMTSRLMVARQGSDVLAWQHGGFPSREDFIAAWDYGEGRAISTGAKIPLGWLQYPSGYTGENRYSPEIIMNMLFWITKTALIDDVEVFHRMKSDLSEFRTRMAVLFSLKDFIDRFGANTNRLQREITSLEEVYSLAADQYLEHDFAESEITIGSALDALPGLETLARKEKDRSLLWVYIVEWLVTASALTISGFVVWTLMIRRRLYRSVKTTRLAGEDDQG